MDRDATLLAECLHEIAAASRIAAAAVYRAYPIIRRRVLATIAPTHYRTAAIAISDFESALGLDGIADAKSSLIVGFTTGVDGSGNACVALSSTPIALSNDRFRALLSAARDASIGDSEALAAWIEDNDSVANACYRAGVRPEQLVEFLRVCAEGFAIQE